MGKPIKQDPPGHLLHPQWSTCNSHVGFSSQLNARLRNVPTHQRELIPQQCQFRFGKDRQENPGKLSVRYAIVNILNLFGIFDFCPVFPARNLSCLEALVPVVLASLFLNLTLA